MEKRLEFKDELEEKEEKETLSTRPVVPKFQSIVSGRQFGYANAVSGSLLKTAPTNRVVYNEVYSSSQGTHFGRKKVSAIIFFNILAIFVALLSIVWVNQSGAEITVQMDPYCIFDVYTDDCDGPFDDSIISFPQARVNKALSKVQYIPYGTEQSPRLSKPFNIKKSKFTVPFNGIYYFYFRGYKGTHSCDIHFVTNKHSELFKCPNNTRKGDIVTWTIMRVLNRDSIIQLRSQEYKPALKQKFFTCSASKKMEFIGMLLKNLEVEVPLTKF